MSTARTWAVALTGVDGHLIEVEADLSNQTPGFRIIGSVIARGADDLLVDGHPADVAGWDPYRDWDSSAG